MHVGTVWLGLKMSVYEIDPLCDPRWPEFLQKNPRASVFHTAGWLEALKRTYGYEPVAYTTSAPEAELASAWVFCRICSWLTGRRLVSLPFSDHCEPLVNNPEHLEELSRVLRRERDEHHWDYIEYRPLSAQPVMGGFESSETFCFHKLDLQPDLARLFRGLHKDSTQRKIRRAEREGLTCDEGWSEPLLDQFYRLLVMTRRRKRLAQATNVNVDGALFNEHVLAPDFVEQARPGEHSAGVRHEEMQKTKLGGPQIDRLTLGSPAKACWTDSALRVPQSHISATRYNFNINPLAPATLNGKECWLMLPGVFSPPPGSCCTDILDSRFSGFDSEREMTAHTRNADGKLAKLFSPRP